MMKKRKNHRMKKVQQFFAVWLCMLYFVGCDASEELLLIPQDTTEECNLDEMMAESHVEAKKEIVYVHVCGAVQRSGVYELEEGARVSDAIQLAGDMTEEADKDYLNLAQFVTDGMQIRVPTKEETNHVPIDGNNGKNALVNINTADEATLCTLTGIGSARAKSIIAYREEHGNFTCIEDIMKVTGIKESSFEKIKDRITV